MNENHLPLDYRPVGEDRTTVPADVCDTCSDFEKGILVPVSFCGVAKQRSAEFYAYLQGGVLPGWMAKR